MSVKRTHEMMTEIGLSHSVLKIKPECVKNKAFKYFLIQKAFKNIQRTESSLLKTKHSFSKSNKKLF